jgi:hypothetical protein
MDGISGDVEITDLAAARSNGDQVAAAARQ